MSDQVKVDIQFFCPICGETFDYPNTEIGDGLLRLHISINHPPEYPGYAPSANDQGFW